MAGAAFSLRRVRVTVSKDQLNQIADILGVSKIHREAILKDGVLITAPPSSTGPAARSARSSTASRTKRRRT